MIVAYMNEDLLMPTLVNDGVRYIHLLALAIGIGASFFADYNVFRSLRGNVQPSLLEKLHDCHCIVWSALFVMWASGVALIYMRTGFVLENFSPKLFAKILVVTALTVNAIIIGRLAVPCLKDQLGKALLNLPLSLRLPMACIAAVSALSWVLALALGSSRFLAQATADFYYSLLPAAYSVSIAVALLCALSIGMARRSSAQPGNWPE